MVGFADANDVSMVSAAQKCGPAGPMRVAGVEWIMAGASPMEDIRVMSDKSGAECASFRISEAREMKGR
jgi:hypothetical protein